MSTDQVAESTDEPASPSPLARAGRLIATAARRLPVTAAFIVILLVTGIVFQALWRHAGNASWFVHVAYGMPALEAGR